MHLGRFGARFASSSEGALVAFAAGLACLLTDVAKQVLCFTWPVVPCSTKALLVSGMIGNSTKDYGGRA